MASLPPDSAVSVLSGPAGPNGPLTHETRAAWWRGGDRRRIAPRFLSVLALVWIAAIGIAAIAAPLLPLQNPDRSNLGAIFAPVSWGHLLGTDATGRDIFARVIWGGRSALLGPLAIVLISAAIAVVIALVGVWYGGWVDRILGSLLNLLFAFPAILLVLVAGAAIGTGLKTAIVTLTIAGIPYKARVARSAAKRERNLPYIRALEIHGKTGASICLRHILPNISPIIVTQMIVSFGYATVDLAAIDYLGLGVVPPSPDWGQMVSEGQPNIVLGHPLESLFAGLAIVLTVGAFTVVGDRYNARHARIGRR